MTELTPPRDTTDTEGRDLTPFIDALARAQYLDLDSHAGTMTWAEYKADDPSGASALYVRPMAKYVLRAIIKFPPRAQDATRDAALRAEALREAADAVEALWAGHFNPAPWLRERADRIAGGAL